MAHSEGSFVRWQATALTQLGYAVNLILSFATASLGFSLTLAKDASYKPTCAARYFWIAAVLLLVTSITFGVWCVLNRLADFRKTTQIAKDREILTRDELQDQLPKEYKESIRIRLECRRLKTQSLSDRTRICFYLQVAAFGAGDCALLLAFVVAYRAKLF
jgi:lysylphosphatidylglycerol synthetase-like protein (DUF2156 family)